MRATRPPRSALALALIAALGCEAGTVSTGRDAGRPGAGGAGGDLSGGVDAAIIGLFDDGRPSRPQDGGALPVGDGGPPEDDPACGATEICENLFDDDCDGRIDEGCPCRQAEKPCYGGDPRDLEAGGACQPGTQTCQLEFYGPCQGEIRPTPETCNGLDDDCDGATDEGTECANQPPRALCPPDQVGPPLARYPLEGGFEDPDGDGLARATWSLLEAPAGATGRPDPADRLGSALFADLQGEYLLQLEVEDTAGQRSRCTTRVRAVESSDGLRIELVWNAGAANDASDVDLHLKRSPDARWHDRAPDGDDCHWRNCSVCSNEGAGGGEAGCRALLADLNRSPAGPPPQVMWTAPLDADDPRLDLDDVQGQGPENINIRTPRPGTWRLGVHYWDDDGFGDSTVTLRVFCGDELARAFDPVTLRAIGRNGDDATEFWEVADIEWRADGSCAVRDLAPPDCLRICDNGTATARGCPPGQSRGVACR